MAALISVAELVDQLCSLDKYLQQLQVVTFLRLLPSTLGENSYVLLRPINFVFTKLLKTQITFYSSYRFLNGYFMVMTTLFTALTIPVTTAYSLINIGFVWAPLKTLLQ